MNSATGLFPKRTVIRINPDQPDELFELLALCRNGRILLPLALLMPVTGIVTMMN